MKINNAIKTSLKIVGKINIHPLNCVVARLKRGDSLMDLMNIKVRHKVFGDGITVAKENSYITVKFCNEEKKFIYPNAFDGYLTAEDIDIANNIKQAIDTIKKLEQEKKKERAEKEEEKQIPMIYNKEHLKVKTKAYPRANIAFKCNYCDGGRSDEQVGFNGVCSDEMIRNNIELEKRTWCSSDDCECGDYLIGNSTRSELDNIHSDGGYVCYESQMLRDWRALAGIVQRGERAGQPMKLNKVQNNSLCVLTTRIPNSTEKDRFIFGVFLVDETYEGDNSEEGYVSTKSKYRIKLSPEQAKRMLFWDYHENDNQPEVAVWSSGLHRYFEDEQAIQILRDIVSLKRRTDEEELSKEFLLYFSKINNVDINSVPEKNGALQRK